MPPDNTDFSPSTLALMKRHVTATQRSLAAMAARTVPDNALFAELDSVHAALRALPLAERVRAMSVLTWACQMMGMSPLEAAPLLCDRLGVQRSEVFSVNLTASDTARFRALAESLVLGRPLTAPSTHNTSQDLAAIAHLGAAIVDTLATVDHVAQLSARKRRELESNAATIKAWDEGRRYAAIQILALFFQESYTDKGAVSLASNLLDVVAPRNAQPERWVQTECERMVAERYPLPPLDRVAGLVRMAVMISISERGSKGTPPAAATDLNSAFEQVWPIERDFALVLSAAVHQQLQLKISKRIPKAPKSADTWFLKRYPLEIKGIARQFASELRACL